ncbi:hypothetical protein H6Y63_22745 [Salmonella enterica subsp. enterica serovar Typhimurium]|nr:hypothetical protein [Rhizobium laguerreae]MBC2627504.1 hypothetical protein [Salmonella enterica subsp. enterica serovar Typhimurium]NKM22856.1 hypothetical protein [Rhizobium laguerreae]NKM32090.1 hypothetical protein [Rhizobium laguerreae]
MKVEVWRPACWPVWHNLDLVRDYNDHHLVSRTRGDVATYMMLSGVDVYMLGAVADPQTRTQMTMLPRFKPPSTGASQFFVVTVRLTIAGESRLPLLECTNDFECLGTG